MGLILPEEDDDAEPIILTDILGSEDALGTMAPGERLGAR